MKGCTLNQSPYHTGLSILAALCLIICFTGIIEATNLDDAPNPDRAKRQIAYADIPTGLCGWLEKEGVGENNFSDHITAINRSTAERELRGEYDHLIFLLLQARRLPGRRNIQPAL